LRLGLVAPFIEEALKGAAVLFVAWRYRREFDNVLDGVIYGATVGFGFAMASNVVHYVGSFLLWGFEGLNAGVFAEGIVQALNHALYTSILGAALGFARLVRRRWQRWTVPLGGFVLAVAIHMLHNLLARRLVGFNPLTALVTVAGLVLIVGVAAGSLARQRQCLRAELRGEVPGDLYRAMLAPGGRMRAQLRALRRGGIGAWREARRLHQLWAELAFKKQQTRFHPDHADLAQELERLRRELASEG